MPITTPHVPGVVGGVEKHPPGAESRLAFACPIVHLNSAGIGKHISGVILPTIRKFFLEAQRESATYV